MRASDAVLRLRFTYATVCAIAIGVAACGKTKADSCADVVDSPGGPVPRQCTYEVPNGASVQVDGNGNTIVTLNGNVVATYPPCPCGSGKIGLTPATVDADVDAREVGDASTDSPPPACDGGCVCHTTAASCPSGCYRSYTGAADGGLTFAGCLDEKAPASATPDGGVSCTYADGGAPGMPSSFSSSCPTSGCPSGTVCVEETGGVAGGGGSYCAPIPVECDGVPTCGCMSRCACRSGVGLEPESCEDSDAALACSNGVT